MELATQQFSLTHTHAYIEIRSLRYHTKAVASSSRFPGGLPEYQNELGPSGEVADAIYQSVQVWAICVSNFEVFDTGHGHLESVGHNLE